jgi:2-C-methyl-D-erythritol 2,4-cyclodiphosphate synthase
MTKYPRIGFGYDVHQFVKGRPCMLGGIEIPHTHGLLGHSDADALLHAITDAILGALALGDIGTHYPDSDPAWENADSKKLLREVMAMVREKGWEIGNVDATVVTEYPKLNPWIGDIRASIASVLNCSLDQISVKATTQEKMGFVGEGRGLAVHAVVLLQP